MVPKFSVRNGSSKMLRRMCLLYGDSLPDQVFHTRFSSSTVTRALLVVPHIQYFHLDQNIFMILPLLMA